MRRVAASASRAAVAFVAMEPVAYAAHRWLMHGPGWSWHADHHRRHHQRWERNDRFPLTFAALTFTAMAAGASVPRLRWLRDVGVGISAYGVAYALVHDVVIHQRLSRPVRSPRLDRLVDAHRRHHLGGGEPYGMLAPVVPRTQRELAPR